MKSFKFALLALLFNLSAAVDVDNLRPRSREVRGMNGKSGGNGGKSGGKGKSAKDCGEEISSAILDGTCTPLEVPLVPLLAAAVAVFEIVTDGGSTAAEKLEDLAEALDPLVALLAASCITAGGSLVTPYFQNGMVTAVPGALGIGLLAFSGQAYCCPDFPESATAATCSAMGGGFASIMPASTAMSPAVCCATEGGTDIAPAMIAAFQAVVALVPGRRRRLSAGEPTMDNEDLIKIIAAQQQIKAGN